MPTKKMWEHTQKLAIFQQLQTYSIAIHKKCGERRSHAFPPHYTPGCNPF